MGNCNSLCLLRTSIKLNLDCDLNGSKWRETKIYSDTRDGFWGQENVQGAMPFDF